MGDLRTIPGVGKNIKRNLLDIDIDSIEDLKGKSPGRIICDGLPEKRISGGRMSTLCVPVCGLLCGTRAT